MSVEFESIVALCRLADGCELVDASLHIRITNSPEVERLVASAAAFRVAEIFNEGQQLHHALSAVPAGKEVQLRFDGLASNQRVIRARLEDLLSYQQGLFLVKAPQEYFLLEERYATGDEQVPELVQAYQRIPRLMEVISSVADVVLDESTWAPTFVLLSGKRLDFIPKYDVNVLKLIPPVSSIDALLVELQSAPFIEAKKSIFKKVLVRLLEGTSVEARFSEFARNFEVAREAFAADYDLYRTEFNFEKVRESFEQKRLAFVLQLNATTSDLLGKMLAIPIGQGIVVSQMKADPAASVGNAALLLGSIVFAAIAALLLVNQHHSLRQIKNEISVERESLRLRFPQLHLRLTGMFELLRKRAELHTWAFPAAVILLLSATTAYSVYAFTKVPPMTAIPAPPSGEEEHPSRTPEAMQKDDRLPTSPAISSPPSSEEKATPSPPAAKPKAS